MSRAEHLLNLTMPASSKLHVSKKGDVVSVDYFRQDATRNCAVHVTTVVGLYISVGEERDDSDDIWNVFTLIALGANKSSEYEWEHFLQTKAFDSYIRHVSFVDSHNIPVDYLLVYLKMYAKRKKAVGTVVLNKYPKATANNYKDIREQPRQCRCATETYRQLTHPSPR